MSQHADIAKHCLTLAIKKDFTRQECLENLNGTLCAAGYDEDMECPDYELDNWIKGILLGQRDGLYGVSHAQVNEWLSKH
jgi:hypothetical protein